MKQKRRKLKVYEAKDLDLGRSRRILVHSTLTPHSMRHDEHTGTRPMSVFLNELKNVSKL